MTGPRGDLTLLGRLVDASNGTFLAADEDATRWIYKPVAGEAPLWDFPPETLGRREVAAFEVSRRLGLDVVPLTVWCDGPLGEGSAQRFVDAGPTGLVDLVEPDDLTEEWLPVLSAMTEDDQPVILAHRDDRRLRRIALFDILINNADRKASHLLESDGDVLGVDHGVCLNADDKLRTVLWGWSGDPLTDDDRSIASAAASLTPPEESGLEAREWEAMAARAEALLADGAFPGPGGRWPAIPWPPL